MPFKYRALWNMITLVAADNDMVTSLRPDPQWPHEIEAYQLNLVAGLLTEAQQEIVCCGEHKEAEKILAEFVDGPELGKYLDEIFDGKYSKNFFHD